MELRFAGVFRHTEFTSNLDVRIPLDRVENEDDACSLRQ